MRELDVTTRDGRTVRVREAGPVDGLPVFVHHGTPSGGLLWEPWVADASERGLRLVTHDRPGYGGSDPHPGRKVSSVVADVADVADHLGLDRYATWGISGGGPHALACAALGEGRCVAAAALASVAPYGAEGLDWFAGMGEDNVREFKMTETDPDGLKALTEESAKMMLEAEPADLFKGLETLVGDVDKAVLSDELGRFLSESAHAGLGSSIEGWMEDNFVFVDPWGFELRDIDVPVLVYQGREDRMVPYGHGEWIARQIPGAEARLSEEEGHLTLLVNRVSDTHAWLKERF